MPAGGRDALVAAIYQRLLDRGWRFAKYSARDVVGEIVPARWRRCLDGYNDGLVPADHAASGSNSVTRPLRSRSRRSRPWANRMSTSP